MKIFSLVSLAAILNCLTPVLATSNYQCNNKVLGAQYIDQAVETEYNRLGQNFVTIGFTKTKEVLWVKAMANEVEFNCEPTTLPAVKFHFDVGNKAPTV
uniref:Bgt_avrF2_6 n=1 Tax=Blumeria graminis f. sp. tritici 96224 TaxID=1268274 RepID=A0A381L388_BLUGR